MKMRTFITLLSCLMTLLLIAPASAQSEADKATARALSIEANQALEAKDYKTAADKFKRAEALYHAPTLLVGLGRAYVGLEKWVEAMESYNRVIREPLGDNPNEAFLQAVEDAKREVVGLDAKIAWVTINVAGPDEPNVTLDGTAVSIASLGVKRAVNPGDHTIEASAEGFENGSESFSITSGETKDVTLTLEPGELPPPPPPGGEESSVLPIVGWTLVGVGGASLILGAVMGGLAIGKHGDLSDICRDDGSCPESEQDNLDTFRTFGTVSTIGFIAGGVLAAGGVVILLVAPGGDSGDSGADSIALEVGPAHLQATYRF